MSTESILIKIAGISDGGRNTAAEIRSVLSDMTFSITGNTVEIDQIKAMPPIFTNVEVGRLQDLIYQIATRSVSRDKTTLEKGVLTNVIFNWNVILNDDILITADFDGVDVSTNLIGNQTFNVKDDTTKTLTLLVSRSGSNINMNTSATSNFYIPQYKGKITTDEPITTYVGLSTYNKTISSSTNLTLESTLNNEYLFFICNSSTKTVKDNLTGFTLSLGEWSSTTAFFIKKSITITLADGTTEDVTIYRTREKKTQTLNISLI